MIWCTSKRWSKSWSLRTYIHTYICREACSGEQTTEGALHDLNYPEMQEAEEERRRRPFNRMSQSKNPLAQPLICTSSASEGSSGTTDMYTYTPCTYSRVRLWSHRLLLSRWKSTVESRGWDIELCNITFNHQSLSIAAHLSGNFIKE